MTDREMRAKAQAELIRALSPLLPYPEAAESLASILDEALHGRAAAAQAVLRPGAVLSFAEGISDAVARLYEDVVSAFAPLVVPGAGLPVGAAAPRRLEKPLIFSDRVAVDIVVEWSSNSIRIAASVTPSVAERVVVFFEPIGADVPLAAVALPSGRGHAEEDVSLEQLGFNPTSIPWKLRVVLA